MYVPFTSFPTYRQSSEPYSCVPMRVDHWGAIQHRLTWFAASTTDDDANICNSMWCDFVYNHSSRYSMLLLYSTLLAWLTHITHDEGITQILFGNYPRGCWFFIISRMQQQMMRREKRWIKRLLLLLCTEILQQLRIESTVDYIEWQPPD